MTLTSHAAPDPRMKPIVVPAAGGTADETAHQGRCQLRRVHHRAVNSPPSEKPWTSRIVTSRIGAATPTWL